MCRLISFLHPNKAFESCSRCHRRCLWFAVGALGATGFDDPLCILRIALRLITWPVVIKFTMGDSPQVGPLRVPGAPQRNLPLLTSHVNVVLCAVTEVSIGNFLGRVLGASHRAPTLAALISKGHVIKRDAILKIQRRPSKPVTPRSLTAKQRHLQWRREQLLKACRCLVSNLAIYYDPTVTVT